MRDDLLKLLRDNPLTLPEIVSHLRRVGIADAHKAGEVLRAMAREVPAWVAEVEGIWKRLAVIEKPKQEAQRSLFE